MEVLPIIGAIVCGFIVLGSLANVTDRKCRGQYRRISAIVLAISLLLCIGFIVLATVMANQEKDQPTAEQLSTIQQVTAELRRLEFQPPPGQTFDDLTLYHFTQADSKKGTVEVINDEGRRVSFEFVISETTASIGCTVTGEFRSAAPYGAILLRGTRGCDT